jgi:AraC-like DNA-binding protein
MPILGRGRILMWQGGSLWILEGSTAARTPARTLDAHSHHAVQVTLGLEGEFELESGTCRIGNPAAAVAPDARHSFRAEGLVAHVFIEPESLAGRAAAGSLFASGAPLVALPEELLGELPAQLMAAFRRQERSDGSLTVLAQAVISRLAGGVIAQPPDARVKTVLEWAATQLDRPVSLVDAARRVALSKDRLRHLFVEQTGLPLRSYLLWLRLTRGIEAFAAGASLTDAAHQAGFADSAHFSRTFRRMFGINAAALQVAGSTPTNGA